MFPALSAQSAYEILAVLFRLACAGRSEDIREAARLAYNAISDRAAAQFPNHHAALVDPWGFSDYSDSHKEEFGFRPRGFISAAEVKRWLQRPEGHQ